jgi:hypothetical protein
LSGELITSTVLKSALAEFMEINRNKSIIIFEKTIDLMLDNWFNNFCHYFCSLVFLIKKYTFYNLLPHFR